MVVKCLHECKLLHGSESWQIEPGGGVSMFVIISLVFDRAEASAPETVELEALVDITTQVYWNLLLSRISRLRSWRSHSLIWNIINFPPSHPSTPPHHAHPSYPDLTYLHPYLPTNLPSYLSTLLNYLLYAILVGADVNIGFFADAYFVADWQKSIATG